MVIPSPHPAKIPRDCLRNKEPIRLVKAVGLRYVNDTRPGIERRRAGKGFSYLTPDRQPIHDAETLRRIRALAIPPAWSQVWICADPQGHLQATGRDGQGRKQYRYHPLWSKTRNQTKYFSLIAFAECLPLLRERSGRDLARTSLCRERVLAAVVRLLEATLIRIGNEEYARSNQSYGLTTLKDQHVHIEGAKLQFRFRGKSGVQHDITLQDRRLARLVKRCRDLPGYDLFQYLDEENQPQSIGSDDVNDYINKLTGQDFTAKDFRTWGGTVRAARILARLGPPASESEAKRNLVQSVKEVATHLGNRPATCRSYYIHPALFEAYQDGSLFEAFARYQASGLEPPGSGPATVLNPDDCLSPDEQAVLEILQQALARHVRD